MQINQSFNIYNRLACLVLLLTFSPVTRGWTSINRKYNIPNVASNQDDLSRRQIFGFFTSALTIGGISFATSSPARAFDRQIEKFSYSINIPPTMQQSQKPVKTHQDEVNFKSDDVKGYQYGITVDPVRINSLKEFGTPEEIAAKVVTAEVNRDGIFEVTLLKDPFESKDGAYILEYLSVGKRGDKHYLNKIFINNNELYVLTAQCKEENYSMQAKEMKETLESFKV